MPNWCEGSLKVRGKKKDVYRFFTEGVQYYEGRFVNDKVVSVPMEKEKWVSIREYEDFIDIYYLKSGIYVEGTQRAFVDKGHDIHIPNDVSDDTVVTSCIAIRQAWEFVIQDWVELSKKYDLHMKLYGIESGMLFVQEAEFNNGELISNHVTKYEDSDDFNWNCPFPWMGG